jgi:hypothetical protein
MLGVSGVATGYRKAIAVLSMIILVNDERPLNKDLVCGGAAVVGFVALGAVLNWLFTYRLACYSLAWASEHKRD